MLRRMIPWWLFVGRLSCCFTTAHLLKKFSYYDVLKRRSVVAECTLRETNIFAPENRPGPNRKVVFQASIFKGENVSFREGSRWELPQKVMNICEENHGSSSHCSQGAFLDSRVSFQHLGYHRFWRGFAACLFERSFLFTLTTWGSDLILTHNFSKRVFVQPPRFNKKSLLSENIGTFVKTHL